MASLRFATIAIGGVIIDIAGTVIGTIGVGITTAVITVTGTTGTITIMGTTGIVSVTFGMVAACLTTISTSTSTATCNVGAPFSLRSTGRNPRGPVARTPL